MLETNHVPKQDMSTSTTGCCPQFDLKAWDGEVITLENKNFVRASTRSFMYMPLNMSKVIAKTWKAIEDAGAKDPDEFIMLSQDVSLWKANHYFWTTKDVPGQDNVRLSGKFLCKVFEGEFKDAGKWFKELLELGKSKNPNFLPSDAYFYYTTCPKCAKVYGKNYVVGLVKVG